MGLSMQTQTLITVIRLRKLPGTMIILTESFPDFHRPPPSVKILA